MKPAEQKLLVAIDKGIATRQESNNRWHLGASLIGRPCAREIWYRFRWVKDTPVPPRVQRIFDRGHSEEERIIKWLRDAGVTVNCTTSDGKQHRVMDASGHFGGSLDALLSTVPGVPPSVVYVGEFKTHNEKSFANVSARGVRVAKPEHFTQMCVYMGERKTLFGIYLAVNKNDDDIYIEYIEYDAATHAAAQARADFILNADEPPPRISVNPAFWICKMCSFHAVCHGEEVADVNCRTCAHVQLAPKGKWRCTKHDYLFSKEHEEKASTASVIPRMADGCVDHVFNPHMLNGVTFLGGDEKENFSILRMPDGRVVNNGPNHIPSHTLCLSSRSPIKPKPSTKPSSTSTRAKKGMA